MEETFSERREAFLEEFRQCQAALFALGDNTRQCIIITLIKNGGKGGLRVDRKSTRLNSSHANISYAVFCLKKKNFFNDTATTEIYTLSLHDALPISPSVKAMQPSSWITRRKVGMTSNKADYVK